MHWYKCPNNGCEEALQQYGAGIFFSYLERLLILCGETTLIQTQFTH